MGFVGSWSIALSIRVFVDVAAAAASSGSPSAGIATVDATDDDDDAVAAAVVVLVDVGGVEVVIEDSVVALGIDVVEVEPLVVVAGGVAAEESLVFSLLSEVGGPCS